MHFYLTSIHNALYMANRTQNCMEDCLLATKMCPRGLPTVALVCIVCQYSWSIDFHPRLDLSSLPHSDYPEQRSYGARHFHQVQRVWMTSFILPLNTPARRRTKQGGLWYHTFGYRTSPTRCSEWNLLGAVLFRLASTSTTPAAVCISAWFCLTT
jgi:hypothetical protein